MGKVGDAFRVEEFSLCDADAMILSCFLNDCQSVEMIDGQEKTEEVQGEK